MPSSWWSHACPANLPRKFASQRVLACPANLETSTFCQTPPLVAHVVAAAVFAWEMLAVRGSKATTFPGQGRRILVVSPTLISIFLSKKASRGCHVIEGDNIESCSADRSTKCCVCGSEACLTNITWWKPSIIKSDIHRSHF